MPTKPPALIYNFKVGTGATGRYLDCSGGTIKYAIDGTTVTVTDYIEWLENEQSCKSAEIIKLKADYEWILRGFKHYRDALDDIAEGDHPDEASEKALEALEADWP